MKANPVAEIDAFSNKFIISLKIIVNTLNISFRKLSVQTIVKYKFLHFSWWWMGWFLVDYLDRWLLYYLWFRNWIWYQNQILYESVTSLWWKTMACRMSISTLVFDAPSFTALFVLSNSEISSSSFFLSSFSSSSWTFSTKFLI